MLYKEPFGRLSVGIFFENWPNFFSSHNIVLYKAYFFKKKCLLKMHIAFLICSCTMYILCTRCPNKHGNSVTSSILSLLWISIVIPNFKSHDIIMSARVYFIKRVKGVSIMSLQNEQWRRTSLLRLYTAIFLYY